MKHSGVSKADMRSRCLILRRRKYAYSNKPEFLFMKCYGKTLAFISYKLSLDLTLAHDEEPEEDQWRTRKGRAVNQFN